LIVEIFDEEEKSLSTRYEGILRALSSGRTRLSEIASFLYSNKIIEKQDISSIKPYIKTLIEIGLIKRIPEYFGKRFYYFVHSPMADLFYYLDEKYNFSEKDINKKYIIEKIPIHVEHFFRELLSKLFELRLFVINKPDLEIDIVLCDFSKLKLVGEVKWKRYVSRSEINVIEKKLKKFKGCKKVLIVPKKNVLEKIPSDIDVWDIEKILKMIQNKSTKHLNI
jgi:hypothetical protein